jgi:hypothetical protein
MTKVEFYNSIVSVYQKTGQGVPGFLRLRLPDPSIVDELISDGLIKSVTINYSHLPNDEFLCLTKGYCVEEEGKDASALLCLRMYLGIDPVIDMGQTQLSREDAFKRVDVMSKYAAWLTKNEVSLKEMETISPLPDEEIDTNLNEETISYLKTRSWYKDNLKVSNCIEQLKSGDNDVDNNIHISKRIIELYKQKLDLHNRKGDTLGANECLKGISESEEEIEEYKKAKKVFRPKIKLFLEAQDKNLKIKEII